MSTEKKDNILVPKLRFKEFEDVWEEKQLKDACKMQAGKFVSASDINEYLNDNMFPCYGGNGLRGYTKSYTHEGNFSLIGRQGALCGNVTFASGRFHATEHALVTTPAQYADNLWLYYLLVYLNLNQYATGQAQPGLSVEVLEKVNINIPKTKLEQQKIADCLSSLDEVITAENQKLDTLKAHKKGLLQQLFPAEGEAVPKLRFKGFEDVWEEKQLKDACKMQAGKFVSASDINEYLNDNMFPCYGGNGLRGYTKSYTHEGNFSLIGRQGALCGNVTFASGRFHATEHALVTTPAQYADNLWLYYLLVYLNLNQYATGQAQPGLSVEVLEKVNINIPKTKLEQQKIAYCLSSIDDLITTQTQKIEALKTHKKGLMQGLFPTIDN